jgi:hypothetical protein
MALRDSLRTDLCPLGHRCESCGSEAPGLAVVTRTVLSDVLCLTLCSGCAAVAGRLRSCCRPRSGWSRPIDNIFRACKAGHQA